MKRFLDSVTVILASRIFFWLIFIFFVVEAVWIAFSAVYPMPFDEDFHFGLIKLYATHWSPFLMQQPIGADAYGAVARDPSYLYHYLMSFPYRVLMQMTTNVMKQIIALRCINIALFSYSILLFRQILLLLTKSKAFTNVCLGIFALIPIVPQLAAHMNYDNLLMVCVAWTCLLVIRIHLKLREKVLDLPRLIVLMTFCLVASIVKYTFLPIIISVAIFVAYDIWKTFRPHVLQECMQSWRKFSRKAQIASLAIIVISFGLFFQRIGINMVKYHQPAPDCAQVLTVAHCSAYGPWNRDYQYKQVKGSVDRNPISYVITWLKAMQWRLFFAINSSAQAYTNYPPLPIPFTTSTVLAIVGAILVGVYSFKIFKQPLFLFCGLVLVVYCGALWFDDYSMYLQTGQPVAINGRYLIPVIPLIAALAYQGFRYTLQRLKLQWIKPILAVGVLVLFLQGGGIFTFIMRSDPSWNWPNSRVTRVNSDARTFFSPIIVQGSKQTTKVF